MSYPQTKVHEQDGKRWWHRCQMCGTTCATHALFRVHVSEAHEKNYYVLRSECLGFDGEYECPGLQDRVPAIPGRRPNGKSIGQHRIGAEMRQALAADRLTKLESVLRAGDNLLCDRYEGNQWCGSPVTTVELPPAYGSGGWRHCLITTCHKGHRVRWDTERITRPTLLTPEEDGWPERGPAVALIDPPGTLNADKSNILKQEAPA